MAEQTTVLITGAKTGIGKALLATFASRPNTTAIAAIRDGSGSPSAKDILTLPTGPNSKIVITAYDAASHTSAKEMITSLQHNHSIRTMDIVIANAGILKHCGLTKDASPETILEHFSVNTLGPILLYQATTSLLNASQRTAKSTVISSNIGSNALMDNYPISTVAYGISKAAVNFVTSKIHREEEKVVVMPVQPGWIRTAMGERAAGYVGINVEKLFDVAEKATHSERMWDQNGKVVPW